MFSSAMQTGTWIYILFIIYKIHLSKFISLFKIDLFINKIEQNIITWTIFLSLISSYSMCSWLKSREYSSWQITQYDNLSGAQRSITPCLKAYVSLHGLLEYMDGKLPKHGPKWVGHLFRFWTYSICFKHFLIELGCWNFDCRFRLPFLYGAFFSKISNWTPHPLWRA